MNTILKLKYLISKNEKIEYGEGSPCKIQYTCKKNGYKEADFLIYLNTKYEIAIVWNLKSQRDDNYDIGTQFLNSSWENVLPNKDELMSYYKVRKKNSNNKYEKVVAMSFESLIENIDFLDELLEFSEDDFNYPKDLKYQKPKEKFIREERTVSIWNRHIKFRKNILERYGYQCAICRCKEVKILEAAHINPVCNNGTDDKKNGICLCRNHHVMFDKGLIEIDFNNLKLTYIENSVKSMPWYNEFLNKYDSKIIKPID